MRELRVLGPPGTGKTTRMARDIGVAATRYGPERVLVASYSKAAASELVSRDLAVPAEMVGTLHAICYRVLERPTIADKQIAEWNEQAGRYRLSGATPKDGQGESATGDYSADQLFADYQRLRALMLPRERWSTNVRSFAAHWEAWKDLHGYLDFTDLIETAIRDIPTAPGDPEVGFFDECQDFSPLEMALVRQWGQHMRSFVLTGDDDQCVFSFRGASPDALLTEIEPEYVRVLEQSYRVPRAVHTWATRWIRQVRRRNDKAYLPRDFEGVVRRRAFSYRDPSTLLRDIRTHLDEGKTCMVLASCAYLLEPFMAHCREEGVPYHNPYKRADEDGHRWNPLTPARGAGVAQRILAYLRPDTGVWGEQARDWTPQDLKLWVELMKADGVLRRGAKGEIAKLGGTGEIGMDRLLAWFEDAALAEAWACSLDWLEAHTLTAKRSKTFGFALTVARRHGAALLRETPRLVVGTAHSVKGGEADRVWVLPDLSRAGMEQWCGGGEGRDAIVRLMYVAATRAREELTLCEPGSRAAVEW